MLIDYDKIQLEQHLTAISDILERKKESLARLRKETEQLKSEHYKNDELAKLKTENERLHAMMRNGFEITNEETENINQWKIKHEEKKHGRKNSKEMFLTGAGGGNYTYMFVPTGIGIIGSVKCSCGAEYCFRDLK